MATFADLLKQIQQMTPDQLAQPVFIVRRDAELADDAVLTLVPDVDGADFVFMTKEDRDHYYSM